MLLEDKVVLITGASRGIGRATAIEAARQGANVAINTWRDAAAAAAVVAEIESLGRRAIVVDADVALPESAAAFVQGAVEASSSPTPASVRSTPSSTCRSRRFGGPWRSTCTAPTS
jgi:NAD(P)-dependent dehydrogenase (short-subunit alcohol dehydrogenase family)